MQRSKLSLVVAISIATAAVAVVIMSGISGSATSADPAPGPKPTPSAGLSQLPDGTAVLVRGVDPKSPRADGGLFELSRGEAAPAGDLRCKRAHVGASGDGICLARHENGIDYEAIVFGRDYEPRARAFIEGVPDRARVSPDGRYAGYTSFDPEGAINYFASARAFSTYTRIVDMKTGEEILRLEDLKVTRDGKTVPVESADPNVAAEFWGLTFTDDGRYYATMASGAEHFLIAGEVGEKTARVVGTEVECPSLSPDGERIAYKRRIGNTNRWRLHVRELDSGRDTALAEPRSIDDQPEWLDGETVIYSDDEATFAVPADGTGRPAELADRATSPAPVP